jgi:phosphatidylserine/phosphatidylglycerophosphate/cardiolipin synthase-like enzyme
VFIDMADYFKAAKNAMSQAKQSVYLLNWAFEADTVFDPQPGGGGPDSDRFGPFLKALAEENPGLDVRVLCWRSSLPIAATQNFFPIADRVTFRKSWVKFVLDGKLPLGACHHQKMIIIDDALAFCGGGDIGRDRWDTDQHLDDDARREKTPADNKCFDSRHETMALVDGPPARALADVFRARWERATGEAMEPMPGVTPDAWPEFVDASFRNVSVGISRTMAGWRGFRPVRESEALSFASIAVARSCIYMENQYFTSPIVAEALSARLEEPDGPEVVLISTQHSPSYFDQMTMDRTRSAFIARLQRSDHHGRLRVYSPVTTLGRTIIVHAKLSIIDDQLLRIGSSNMNNRSAGFDTECDLSIEADAADATARAEIVSIRHRLIAHWLGCPIDRVAATVASEGSLGAAIETMRGAGMARLRPIEPRELGPLATFIATFHIGDPVSPADSWRPWRRRATLRKEIRILVARLARAAAAVRP